MYPAKPVLATVDSKSDTFFIEQAQCSWIGAPENIDWLSEKMKWVSEIRLAELKKNGQLGKEGVRKLADLILEHPETA